MFKFIKNITNSVSKVTPDNNSLSELNNIKKKVNTNNQKDVNYINLLSENEAFFRSIMSNTNNINKSLLEECAKKFLKLIEIKPSKPTSFVYLAYIYYILGDDILTEKYLKIGSFLDSNNENKLFIDELKNLVNRKVYK